MNKTLNKFEIIGGNELNGEIEIQTSKNAVLPIMSASLLLDGKATIKNVPKITDVENMKQILCDLGCQIKEENRDIEINPKGATNANINCKLMKSMRSSLFLLGSMLSRFGSCMISLPGGCNIGKRPIDIHISCLKKLGVGVSRVGEFLFFNAKYAHAGKVKLRLPSVGATENIIQFACKLKGKTTILNPAKEPEIVDLCNYLNLAGAKILGAGTDKITIYGVDKLRNTSYTPIGDRIVEGTIMCAVAVAGGNVTIKNSSASQNKKIIEMLSKMGCQINIKNDIINISKSKALTSIKEFKTGYYPKFPTDLQSLMLAVCCSVEGETRIKETLFENRFLIVPELKKMNAFLKMQGKRKAIITGVCKLKGAKVVAKDLRGGAALVIAALGANGKSIVKNVQFIDRGYESLETQLSSLGANIERK